jgi:helicase
LELVSLRGIGRIRGRVLHNQGLRNLADLYHVPVDELARIPTIGRTIAESIKKQLGVNIQSSLFPIDDSIDDEDLESIQTLLEDFT